MSKQYTLIGPDGKPYQNKIPGTIGGYRPKKIYGTLDCPRAAYWLAKGYYVKHRVFFATEDDAIAAGYRPCFYCMREQYQQWKAKQGPQR